MMMHPAIVSHSTASAGSLTIAHFSQRMLQHYADWKKNVQGGSPDLPMCQNQNIDKFRKKNPTMKFVLRESVPILNRNTPATTKTAALVFLISYCIFLRLLAGLTYGAYLLSVKNFSISTKISSDTLRNITLFSVAALAVWALVKGFLIAKLFFRRRWAKNVLSAIALATFLVVLLIHSMRPEDTSMMLSNNLEHIAEVVAVILLLTPKSTTWFRTKG